MCVTENFTVNSVSKVYKVLGLPTKPKQIRPCLVSDIIAVELLDARGCLLSQGDVFLVKYIIFSTKTLLRFVVQILFLILN